MGNLLPTLIIARALPIIVSVSVVVAVFVVVVVAVGVDSLLERSPSEATCRRIGGGRGTTKTRNQNPPAHLVRRALGEHEQKNAFSLPKARPS